MSTLRLSPSMKVCLAELDVTATDSLFCGGGVLFITVVVVSRGLNRTLYREICTFGLSHFQQAKSLLSDCFSLGEEDFEIGVVRAITFLLYLLEHVLKIDNSVFELLFVSAVRSSSCSLTLPIKIKFLLLFCAISLGCVMLFDFFIELSDQSQLLIPHFLYLAEASSLNLVYELQGLGCELDIGILIHHCSYVLLEIFTCIYRLFGVTPDGCEIGIRYIFGGSGRVVGLGWYCGFSC